MFNFYAILTDPGADERGVKSIKMVRMLRDCELLRDEPKQELEVSFSSPPKLPKPRARKAGSKL